jgi:hypothetical protein
MISFEKLIVSPSWKGSVTRITVMVAISLVMWKLPEIFEWLYRIASWDAPVFSRARHWSMFLMIFAASAFCIVFDLIRLIAIFLRYRSQSSQ